MVAIVGCLTLCFAVLAVRLGVGLPDGSSTLLAEVARRSVGGGWPLAGFQALSALLLLAAAASSYLAGSGVLKALAAIGAEGERGLLPDPLRRENRFLVAHWGVATVWAVATAMILAAGADPQKLVQFYAVSVFASFLAATLGCARLCSATGGRGRWSSTWLGAALVALVLALNLTRLDSAIALLASLGVALYLWRSWVAAGRPDGIIGGEAGM